MKKIALSFLFVLITFFSSGQDRLIKGLVQEKQTENPIPYATVSILGTYQGILSNEKGKFQLLIKEGQDSIKVSCMGYFDTIVSTNGNNLVIELSVRMKNLNTLVVKPRPPEYYVKEAAKRHYGNLPSHPFETLTYFKEFGGVVKKEKELSSKTEAVFKTYYKNFSSKNDSVQQMLVLKRYKKEESKSLISDLEGTVSRLEKKVGRFDMADTSDLSGNEDQNSIPDSSNEELSSLSAEFHPLKILQEFQSAAKLPFFDSTNFDHLKFSFGEPAYYNDKELIAINFKPKGKIDLLFKYRGTIILDSESLAIVSLDYTETLSIPLILKPIIRMFTGMGVGKGTRKVSLKYQEINGLWYPKETIEIFDIKLVEKHMFSANKKYFIFLERILNVSDLNIATPTPVNPEELFNINKGIMNQESYPYDLEWKDVNIISP